MRRAVKKTSQIENIFYSRRIECLEGDKISNFMTNGKKGRPPTGNIYNIVNMYYLDGRCIQYYKYPLE